MHSGTFAVLGLFGAAGSLVKAAQTLRSHSLGHLEAYTPYPVHGLDKALGLPPSKLGRLVLIMGATGTFLALLLQWWTSAIDYPLITSGKPLFSWQAFIPVMFEVTVLFATFTAGLAMLFVFNKLPYFGHPVLHTQAIKEITRDKFALSIESKGADFDVDGARRALIECGAESVEVVPIPKWENTWTLKAFLRTVYGIALACVVAGLGIYAAIKVVPIVPPMVNMHEQPKLNAYKTSSFFRDGRGMQPAVVGTVARGHLPPAFKTPEEAATLLTNPLPFDAKVGERGRKVYEDHCATCHGSVGNGVSRMSTAYGAKPANLVSNDFRTKRDGHFYGVIMLGKNTMSSYAADLDEADRWSVIHYIRALQRAQNAKDEDLR